MPVTYILGFRYVNIISYIFEYIFLISKLYAWLESLAINVCHLYYPWPAILFSLFSLSLCLWWVNLYKG